MSDQRRLERMKLGFVHRLAQRLVHPLTVVTATNSLLVEQAREGRDPQLAAMIEDSVKNSELCARLVHQFLGFTARSCASAVPRGWTSAALEELVAAGARACDDVLREKSFEIAILAPPRSVLLEGDRAKLGIIFEELIENAVRHGNQGGKLLIGAEKEGDRVKVSFLDDGPGFALSEDGQRRQILREVDPYTAEEVPGLGVGLWLVGEATHSLGGKLKISSPANEDQTGTLVQVALPGSAEAGTETPDHEHTMRLAAFTF